MKFIDLFAGAGGLSEGFLRAGFEPVAHVEMDKAACFTLRTRAAFHYLNTYGNPDIYTSYLKGEITRDQLYQTVPNEITGSVINKAIGPENNKEIQQRIDQLLQGDPVDLIIGGPPCQAYSLAGRSRSINGMRGDKRNYLYVQYAEYLEKYKPKMFVFENVLGLESAGNGIYLENMKKLFLKNGYQFQKFKVAANDFGVLQNRKRILIIGWRADLKLTIPDLGNIKNTSQYTVETLLKDLPVIQAGEGRDKFMTYRTETNLYLGNSHIRNGLGVLTQHIARPQTDQDKDKWNNEKERLRYSDLPERLKTHSNQTSFFDRFKVVAADQPYSQTVVAHIAKDGHYYIHPDINQNRSLTVREAARLQSFPDNFYFEGVKEGSGRTAAFKQIGNAVPPLMAFAIAEVIKLALCPKIK